jgi:hypothetical protein
MAQISIETAAEQQQWYSAQIVNYVLYTSQFAALYSFPSTVCLTPVAAPVPTLQTVHVPYTGLSTVPLNTLAPVVALPTSTAFRLATVTYVISLTGPGALGLPGVLVVLDTSSLASSGLMLSDCSDLSVFDRTTNTRRPLWLEPGSCGTQSTKVWVDVGRTNVSSAGLHVEVGGVQSAPPPATPSVRLLTADAVAVPGQLDTRDFSPASIVLDGSQLVLQVRVRRVLPQLPPLPPPLPPLSPPPVLVVAIVSHGLNQSGVSSELRRRCWIRVAEMQPWYARTVWGAAGALE